MNKIISLSILILILLAIVTQVARVYISNTTSLNSILASRLQNQIDVLTEKNLVLRDKVLSKISYQTIASRAASLGLVSTQDIVSVYDPARVAIGR